MKTCKERELTLEQFPSPQDLWQRHIGDGHFTPEIDHEANEMLRLLIEQLAQAQGITEQLKAENQMAWVGAVNNIRSAAEETTSKQSIYN